MKRNIVLVSVVALSLIACGGGGKRDREDFNRAGLAGEVIPADMSATIDLYVLLDPDNAARKKLGRRRWKRLDDPVKLDHVFEAFYASYPVEDRELRRNRIQERLFAVSNQSCAAFKHYLMSNPDKKRGFISGMASVARSATRIVAGPGVGMALRGVESVFSRDKEVFNIELFASLTMQVITDGIDTRRREILETVLKSRADKRIAEYTVEAALKDAIYYHEQCNVFAGMRKAHNLLLKEGL